MPLVAVSRTYRAWVAGKLAERVEVPAGHVPLATWVNVVPSVLTEMVQPVMVPLVPPSWRAE